MDLLTQGILGAVTAQTAARRDETRLAIGTGALAGLLPDADALVRSSSDPLLVLEYHRHFTHSLFFIPIGALIAAVLVWLLSRQRHAFKRVYLCALLGIAFAALLDACTSYGTHLLWPFSQDRIAWNLIAIVDPVFTGLLLIPLIIAIRQHSPVPARMALALAAAYLVFAGIQLHRATRLAEDLIAGRGQHAERLTLKPTLGNLVLWRALYIENGMVHIDAVRVALFTDNRIYPGDSSPLLIPETLSSIPPDSRAATDLKRFAFFSDGWLTVSPTNPNLIGDARYALLPHRNEPLWGVIVDYEKTDQPLPFVTNRNLTRAMREEFMDMLMGQ